MKYDVFVSHSSKDRAVATKLVEYFESRDLKCFISSRDIPHCDNWAEILVQALEESQMVVYLHTATANVSEQVQREIQIAVDNLKIPLITYRLTDEPFLGAKKFFIQSLNWIDSLVNPEANFGMLYDAVKDTLAGLETQKSEQNTKGLFFKRHWKLLVAFVLIIGLGVAGYYMYDTSLQEKQKNLEASSAEYAAAVARLDGLIADKDSIGLIMPCIEAAEKLSSSYDPAVYGSYFIPTATELRQKAADSLNAMSKACCDKVRSYYEGYKVVKSDNIKNVITENINLVSHICEILSQDMPEDIESIKNALL